MGTRSIYIWKLAEVLNAEGSAHKVIEKAALAKISALWVKVADGNSPYANVGAAIAPDFKALITAAHAAGIEVWGWQVPHCATATIAKKEAKLLGDLTTAFQLDGMIMDAEGTSAFFHGGLAEAKAYGSEMAAIASAQGKPLGISSNDIPQNIDGWLPKFNEIAKRATFNFPQTYYGGSPSVTNRVDRAVIGNTHLAIPFVPVGAGFIGTS
ncbi:MAG: hypothetical protein EON54_28715, partial [Alcaligenaceae bacterium]